MQLLVYWEIAVTEGDNVSRGEKERGMLSQEYRDKEFAKQCEGLCSEIEFNPWVVDMCSDGLIEYDMMSNPFSKEPTRIRLIVEAEDCQSEIRRHIPSMAQQVLEAVKVRYHNDRTVVRSAHSQLVYCELRKKGKKVEIEAGFLGLICSEQPGGSYALKYRNRDLGIG